MRGNSDSCRAACNQFGSEDFIENSDHLRTICLIVFSNRTALEMLPGTLSHFVNTRESMLAEISNRLLPSRLLKN